VPRRPGRPPIDQTGELSVPVCVRMPARTYDQLYQRAQRGRSTVPAVIRGILARERRTDAADDDDDDE